MARSSTAAFVAGIVMAAHTMTAAARVHYLQSQISGIMKKSIVLLAAGLLFCAPRSSQAQVSIPYTTVTNDPPVYGPYNGVFLPDGEGLYKKLPENDTVLLADSPWT